MPNHLKAKRQEEIIHLLVEGNSCRSISRLTGAHLETILRHLVMVGQGCKQLLHQRLRNLDLRHIQADEIWTFCTKKQGTLSDAEKLNPHMGDQYLFVALDTDTKLVVTFALGKRTRKTTDVFLKDLARRIVLPELAHEGDKPQLSTDAFGPYREAVDLIFADKIDYGQIVKIYHPSEQPGRYGPPDVVATKRKDIRGIADLWKICTSHIERNNLTIRTFLKRFTRLSLGFSKKRANLWAAICLHVAHYNFCRIHGTLKTTPAVAAGVTEEPWTLEQLLCHSQNGI
jgi:IS1 family transposase